MVWVQMASPCFHDLLASGPLLLLTAGYSFLQLFSNFFPNNVDMNLCRSLSKKIRRWHSFPAELILPMLEICIFYGTVSLSASADKYSGHGVENFNSILRCGKTEMNPNLDPMRRNVWDFAADKSLLVDRRLTSWNNPAKLIFLRIWTNIHIQDAIKVLKIQILFGEFGKSNCVGGSSPCYGKSFSGRCSTACTRPSREAAEESAPCSCSCFRRGWSRGMMDSLCLRAILPRATSPTPKPCAWAWSPKLWVMPETQGPRYQDQHVLESAVQSKHNTILLIIGLSAINRLLLRNWHGRESMIRSMVSIWVRVKSWSWRICSRIFPFPVWVLSILSKFTRFRLDTFTNFLLNLV